MPCPLPVVSVASQLLWGQWGKGIMTYFIDHPFCPTSLPIKSQGLMEREGGSSRAAVGRSSPIYRKFYSLHCGSCLLPRPKPRKHLPASNSFFFLKTDRLWLEPGPCMPGDLLGGWAEERTGEPAPPCLPSTQPMSQRFDLVVPKLGKGRLCLITKPHGNNYVKD